MLAMHPILKELKNRLVWEIENLNYVQEKTNKNKYFYFHECFSAYFVKSLKMVVAELKFSTNFDNA